MTNRRTVVGTFLALAVLLLAPKGAHALVVDCYYDDWLDDWVCDDDGGGGGGGGGGGCDGWGGWYDQCGVCDGDGSRNDIQRSGHSTAARSDEWALENSCLTVTATGEGHSEGLELFVDSATTADSDQIKPFVLYFLSEASTSPL